MAFMRHNNNGRRHNNNRHRHNNNGQQQGQRRHVNRINQVFESNGPEGRVRGTAQQIVEKYLTMARDAQGAGDKVLSMNYFQHAEHYQRVLNDIQEENATFERDREAQRAAQQAAQPDQAENAEAGQGDTDQQEGQSTQTSGDEQGEQAGNKRPPRAASSRAPVQRAPRRKTESDDDLNSLPGFLQVPITESAPPAENAAPSAAKNTVKSDKKNDDVVVEKTRTVRTRRVAAAAKEEAAE